MVKAAVDTDIILKGLCYGLVFELIGSIPSDVSDIGMLGAARFILRIKLCRAKLNSGPERAFRLLEQLLQHTTTLEPTNEEANLAAELEFIAQRASVNLHEGESQLCAIVIRRTLAWLVTGDKRAVRALEQILGAMGNAAELAGKVLCLEQLFLKLMSRGGFPAIRDVICEEPDVDRALSICFGCYSTEASPESWSQGLRSYIADLRTQAKIVLAE